MDKTWFVIAHRAGARILRLTTDGFHLVSAIDHEAGRLKEGEINSDRPGRAYDRTGGGRHAMSTEQSAHDHVATVFAHELAERLRGARNEQRYERLVLVAEPRFLGMLRAALDQPTAALVFASVGKDLAQVPVHEMAPHLRGEVSFV